MASEDDMICRVLSEAELETKASSRWIRFSAGATDHAVLHGTAGDQTVGRRRSAFKLIHA